jgi:hypothetical protein
MTWRGHRVMGVRTPPSSGRSALVSRGVRRKGAALVAVERPAAVPADGEGPEEAAGGCGPLPRARAQRKDGRSQDGQSAGGNTKPSVAELFSVDAAIVLAAMCVSKERGVRPCSVSAAGRAGARWSVWSSGSGGGNGGAPNMHQRLLVVELRGKDGRP